MKNTLKFLIIFTAFIGSNSFAQEVKPAKEFKGCTATEQCCSYDASGTQEFICRDRCGHGEKLHVRADCADLVRPASAVQLPLDIPSEELF